jgi:hypothetical protein
MKPPDLVNHKGIWQGAVLHLAKTEIQSCKAMIGRFSIFGGLVKNKTKVNTICALLCMKEPITCTTWKT